MDFNEQSIRIPRDRLNIYQYLTILLKKLSMNEILTDLQCSFDINFRFKKINTYSFKKLFVFDDHPNNMLAKYIINSSNSHIIHNLNYFTSIKDDDIRIKDESVDKFKNYYTPDRVAIRSLGFTIENKLSITEVNDSLGDQEIDDPYFKQKIDRIGKSIIFHKNYRHSYISFIVLFNKYINDVTDDYNLITLSKFNGLFERLDEEEVISLPEETEVIKFIDTVLKYKKMLKNMMKNKKTFSNVTCSTSIFKIGIDSSNIVLSMNGIQLCNERMIGRFKYINHPGIMLYIKSLKVMGKYELLFTKIQKHIIKTL